GYQKFVYRKRYLLKEILLTVKSRYRMGLFMRNVRYRGQLLSYAKGESSVDRKRQLKKSDS
ncbi:MAG: hypothetical protein ACXADS_13665, partial [Candidatus Thorarchaeota archaeon]